MPETVNTDVAQELSDRNEARHKEHWERVAEIVGEMGRARVRAVPGRHP